MVKTLESIDGEKINVQNTGIFYNKENEKAYKAAVEAANILNLRDIDAKVLTTDEFRTEITFALVLGGDGTILKTARFFAPYDVPIFGINLGRLGFLSQTKSENIREALEYIMQGRYKLEERIMLSAFDGRMEALNDIVIKGDGFSRTSRLFVHINDNTVCDYLADGIIISTPTGSTAYNLSAGGPVLFPTLDAIVIVPICPHTMSARPIVVPSTEVINITSNPNKPLMKISADGQNVWDLIPNQSIEIKKSKNKAKLLLLDVKKNSFYSVLKEKLHWGLSWQG